MRAKALSRHNDPAGAKYRGFLPARLRTKLTPESPSGCADAAPAGADPQTTDCCPWLPCRSAPAPSSLAKKAAPGPRHTPASAQRPASHLRCSSPAPYHRLLLSPLALLHTAQTRPLSHQGWEKICFRVLAARAKPWCSRPWFPPFETARRTEHPAL